MEKMEISSANMFEMNGTKPNEYRGRALRRNDAKKKNSEMLNYIYVRTTQDGNLALLAEEAVELAQAALKMIRVLDSNVATVKDKNKAWEHLTEEFADVNLVARMLDLPEDRGIEDYKLERWYGRIKDEYSRKELK